MSGLQQILHKQNALISKCFHLSSGLNALSLKLLFNGLFRYDSERVIQTHSNQVPFCLVAPGLQQKMSANDALWNAIGGRKVAKKLGVEVTDWSEATRMDMDVTKDIFEAAPSGLADHVWGWVEGEKQLGLQNKECMLLNGTTLTAM